MSVATATETQLNAARSAIVALEHAIQRPVQGDRPIQTVALQALVDAAVAALEPLKDA